MGAINYGESTFLCNLGYNLNNDVDNYEEALDDQRWTAEEVQEYLNDICLSYYKIDFMPGYYMGFYLNIRGDYYADDDKEERVKELHEIGRALIHLTNYFGLVNYTPGASTGYATTGDTIRRIKNSVKKEITKIYNYGETKHQTK